MDIEIRRPVGPRLGQETGQLGLWHTADQPEAPRTRKLFGDIAGAGIALEDLPRHAPLPSGQQAAPSPTQTVLVKLQALHNAICGTLGDVMQGLVQTILVGALQQPRQQASHQQAGQRREEHGNQWNGHLPAVSHSASPSPSRVVQQRGCSQCSARKPQASS